LRFAIFKYRSIQSVQKKKELGYLGRYRDRLWAGRPGFNSWQWQEIFIFSTEFRPALGATQWVLGAPSLGVKRPDREADDSPPSNAEVKNGSNTPPHSHTSS
jgi:hypothetical protein